MEDGDPAGDHERNRRVVGQDGRGRPRVSRIIVVLSALSVLFGSAAAAPRSALAGAQSMIYVDGKIGQDPPLGTTASTTWGRSPAMPFKTIHRALDETKFGDPVAIRIRGYNDYVYHEALTKGYRLGSLATPVVIGAYTSAEDPTAAGVRPIIDGGLDVGTSGWHQPWATTYPHVWCKTWVPPSGNLLSGQRVPPGYDTTVDSTHEDRLYMDGSQPLYRPASVPTISQLNAQPYTQYWDRTKSTDNLCVHLGLWNGAAINENPADHSIVVPWYFGIILAGGSSYVTIEDLRVQHTIMGVGFSVSRDRAVGKAHHNTAYHVDASYNYRMGFWTAGDYNVFERVSGVRNSIQLFKLDSGTYSDGTPYGAQHNTIHNSYSGQNLGHGIKLYGRYVRYNYIYGNTIVGSGIPAVAKSAGGATQGIQISNGASNNAFWRNTIRYTDAGFELYQYDSNGGPLNANSIHHNRLEHVGTGVFLWDAKVSSSFGTGSSVFAHNVYFDNQIAIGGNATTSGKVFDHETIYHTGYLRNPTSPSVDSPAAQVLVGSITIINSIIDDSNGPSICPHAGATVYLSYSDTYRWRDDPRSSMPHGTYCYSTTYHAYGSVKIGSGVVHVNPGYVTDPTSPSFLVVPSSSLVYASGSDGSRLGAL
jgi:hypothetical protein